MSAFLQDFSFPGPLILFFFGAVHCVTINGRMSVFRNRYWSFRIEHKIFAIQLTRDGEGIQISERNKSKKFRFGDQRGSNSVVFGVLAGVVD